MSKTRNLVSDEAVSKLQDLINDSPTCMFGTGLNQIPFHASPMQVQETDYDGKIWFFSGGDSTRNQQINADQRVQLIFTNSSKQEYLTVFGAAEISRDREQIGRLWNRMVEAWFDSPDDPNVTLICVHPQQVHYWDTENGKLITMAKILTAAITDGEMNIGVEGKLDV